MIFSQELLFQLNFILNLIIHDHFYSDGSFPLVLPIIFKHNPKKIFDVGGNTGKFSLQCVRYDNDVSVTIVDLPQQVEMANKNINVMPLHGPPIQTPFEPSIPNT